MADTEFMKLKNQLKEGKLGNLYLFFGDENYIKEVYLEKIKAAVDDGGFPDFNHITIDEKDLTYDAADDALESFPMFVEHKLVIIKNSGIFSKPKEETKKFWEKRLKEIPNYVTLVFDEEAIDKRSTLYKLTAKTGLCVEFAYLKDVDIASWIEREARHAGKKISKNSAAYMASVCDNGLSYVKNELDKLIDYCDEEITVSDIDRVVAKSLDTKVFELTDAIMAKDAAKAVALMYDFKTVKESAFKILYSISGTFDKLLRTKLMSAEGASFSDIAEKAGIKPFLVKKYVNNGKNFSQGYLIDRIMRVAEIDLSIKEGEIDEWTALEQYIIESVEKV